MPGDGRLMPPAPPGRGGIPAGRCGTPVPGPTGRGTPGTAPGASGARGAVDACEVKGLLPIRGGPEVARGTAGPGRGPAAGRDTPGSPGRAYRRLGDGRRRRLCSGCHGCAEDIGRWGRPVRRRSCGRRWCDRRGDRWRRFGGAWLVGRTRGSRCFRRGRWRGNYRRCRERLPQLADNWRLDS